MSRHIYKFNVDESEGWVNGKGTVTIERQDTAETYTIRTEWENDNWETEEIIVGCQTKEAIVEGLKKVDECRSSEEPVDFLSHKYGDDNE